MVVAADLNGGIGYKGKLPWPRLRKEMNHFKRLTTGWYSNSNLNGPSTVSPSVAVIMGRKTFDSLPVPLPGRVNVVVTSNPWQDDAVLTADSLELALQMAAELTKRTFVIGGAKIYEMAFAHSGCRDIYLTKVRGAWPADTFLPNLPKSHTVDKPEVVHQGSDDGIEWQVTRWRKKA